MKLFIRSERGSSHIALIAVLVLIVGVTFVGYRVMKNGQQNTTPAAPPPVAASATPTPGKIKNKSDVQQASKSLDETPINTSLDPKQLDSDLDSIY